MKKYLEKTIKFYDKNVDEYIKNTADLQNKDWLEKFVLHLIKNAKVLDIGCAYGRDCRYFVKNNFETYGIDLSEKMIEKAKNFELKAKFSVMDMLNLDFKDDFLDGIWCSATLLHISKADTPQAIKEFRRVMKKDGVLYLNLKYGKGEKTIKDMRYKDSEKFYSYFEEDEIKKILTDNGFSIIDFEIKMRKEKYMQNSKSIFLIAKKNIQ